jgi:hypothetical protein
MKIATKIILILLIAGLYTESFGQVLKVKANAFSIKAKNENTDKWPEWPKWEETNILITIDSAIERIKIFSKKDQVYDIIEKLDESIDEDGDITWKWLCVNEDGLKCHIRMVRPISGNGRSQLYVEFSDIKWVYSINFID